MTRVVCLLGSPRAGGNSDLLAGRFCEAAAAAGAEVARHYLRDLRFSGYRGDGSAGSNPREDDLTPVLADVQAADVVVLATPIYFCNMTGLLKQAFDRFFCFLKPDYLTNAVPTVLGRDKALVLVQAQGEGPERYGDLLDQYGPALDKLGFMRRDLVRACEVREPGEVMGDEDALERAGRLAEELVQRG